MARGVRDGGKILRGNGRRETDTAVRATRIYLQMTEPGQFRPALGEFPDVMVERVADPAPALYRTCYHTVGAGFHWRDRWHWTDVEIAAHLTQSEISLHVARRGIALAGWYELRRGPADPPGGGAEFWIVPPAIVEGFWENLLLGAGRPASAAGAPARPLPPSTSAPPH